MQIRCRECGNTEDFKVHLDVEIDLEQLWERRDAFLFNLAEVYPFTCKSCGSYEDVEWDFEVEEEIIEMMSALKWERA